MASPALDELLGLLANDYKVDWVRTVPIAETGKDVVEVRLRKGSLEAIVKGNDKDFCDYASAIYSSP